MQEYTKPVLEILELEANVILTSGCGGGVGISPEDGAFNSIPIER